MRPRSMRHNGPPVPPQQVPLLGQRPPTMNLLIQPHAWAYVGQVEAELPGGRDPNNNAPIIVRHVWTGQTKRADIAKHVLPVFAARVDTSLDSKEDACRLALDYADALLKMDAEDMAKVQAPSEEHGSSESAPPHP